MTLATLSDGDRDLLRVAIHEAGHAVAGVLLGGRIHTAVVASGRVDGIGGWTSYDELPDRADSGTTYAGPWAVGRGPLARWWLARLH